MPKIITVKKGDTLNRLAQAEGFKDFRDAGVTSVPSGNFDIIRPGEQITFGNIKSPLDKIEDGATAAKTQSQELQEATEALKATERIDTATDRAGVVATSDDARAEERRTIEDVTRMAAPDPRIEGLTKATEDFTASIDEEIASLEKRRAEQQKQIEAQFAEQEKTLGKEQEKETGTFKVGLQRIGGFLGESASAIGALKNLSVTHKQEQSALEAKKQNALGEANAAISDKQFKLAREKREEAVSLEKEINKRRNDFFDQSLDIIKENRQRQQQQQTAFNQVRDDARASINTMITNFGGLDFTAMDENEVARVTELAEIAGIPVETLQGPTIKQTAAEATERQRQISNAISAANLRAREASLALAEEKFEAGERLSASDASKLGLPRTLVGKNEEEVFNDLNSEIVPTWYTDFVTEGVGVTQTTVEQKKNWDSFRNEVVKTNPLIDFGDFGAPPTGNLSE